MQFKINLARYGINFTLWHMASHLSTALIGVSTGKSMLSISRETGVSQSTLSRMVREDRRADTDTLMALCDKLPKASGAQILLGHLQDEITRAGQSVLDWTVEPNNAVDAGDLAILESAIAGTDKLPNEIAEELSGMVHHLANLVRTFRKTELPLAAEDQAPFHTPKKKKKKPATE